MSIISKISLVVVPLILLVVFAINYNNLVKDEESVSEAYSQIESNLQRKIDLLPNLVKVVKSYAKHETQLFSKITEIRSSATNSPKNIQSMQKLNSRINLSTLKLFAVAENYPILKSSEQFLQLQAQIEGTENRINITRMQYNERVKYFNAQRRIFPANIVAAIFSFDKKEYFMAEHIAHKKIELDL